MNKYTHKPISVIAIQFTGDNVDEVKRLLNESQDSCCQIIKDHLLKDRFIFYRPENGQPDETPIYFKKGDYFFTDYNDDDIYIVDFLEQAEFERKYEVKHD